MSDAHLRSVVIVSLDAGEGETAYVTNNDRSVAFGINTYFSSPEMEIKPSTETIDFSQGEYRINKLDLTIGILARLSLNIPYAKIDVVVQEVFLDDVEAVVSSKYLYKGLIYQVEVKSVQGYIDLICRDHKYYLDTTGGFACLEHCNVPFFGDPNTCQKTIQTEDHVLDSISGFDITLLTDPVLTTPFIFNQGFVEFGASRIKIRYHESGKTFSLSRTPPAYWLGETITIVTGCDKRLETCRDIHNNEERFMGLGIAMVDYNPLYENP